MERTPDRLHRFVEYFAMAEPNVVNKIAYKHGYHAPHSLESREGFLIQFLEDQGDDGLRELMLMHPDKDAINSADGSADTELKTYAIPAPKTQQAGTSNHLVAFCFIVLFVYLIIKG